MLDIDSPITLLDAAAPYAVQLGAARTIIEQSLKLRQHTEIEDRLADVEEQCRRLGDAKPS